MDFTIASNTTAVGSGDTAPATGTPGEFTNGNPATSTPATVLPAYQMNALVQEIRNTIVGAGLTPSNTNNAQLLAAIPLLTPGRLLNVRYFTASGTYTPTTGTNSVVADVQGGGGASGGAPATGSGVYSAGANGGAGAWARKLITSGFSGVTVTVGAGGTGVSGAAGGNGGASSFGALVSANGGSGGGVAGPSGATFFSATGGAGGTAGASGDLNLAGAAGGNAGITTGNGIYLPVPLSLYGASYGCGGAMTANPASSSVQVGGSGKPGLVIVWEYA